jgi:hypothetical protein
MSLSTSWIKLGEVSEGTMGQVTCTNPDVRVNDVPSVSCPATTTAFCSSSLLFHRGVLRLSLNSLPQLQQRR